MVLLTLEDKDIIQVDATVIIGVMILLTLSIGFDSSINAQKEENLTRLLITLAIIAPFTASAVLAILTNLTSKYTAQLKRTSILIMAVGFGYLIFVIAAFMASLYYLIWLDSTYIAELLILVSTFLGIGTCEAIGSKNGILGSKNGILDVKLTSTLQRFWNV